jgi:nitrate/nitrite transporter NarK
VLLQGCTPPKQIGLAVGVYNSVGNIAGMVQPIVTGFVIKLTGSYTPAFILAAAMLAASSLSYWYIVGELKNANSDRYN